MSAVKSSHNGKNTAAAGEKLQQEMLSLKETQDIFVYIIGNYKVRSIGVM